MGDAGVVTIQARISHGGVPEIAGRVGRAFTGGILELQVISMPRPVAHITQRIRAISSLTVSRASSLCSGAWHYVTAKRLTRQPRSTAVGHYGVRLIRTIGFALRPRRAAIHRRWGAAERSSVPIAALAAASGQMHVRAHVLRRAVLPIVAEPGVAKPGSSLQRVRHAGAIA